MLTLIPLLACIALYIVSATKIFRAALMEHKRPRLDDTPSIERNVASTGVVLLSKFELLPEDVKWMIYQITSESLNEIRIVSDLVNDVLLIVASGFEVHLIS